ncbi:MAG: sensor histidine kinase [Propioniciclava sp.]|uniref:sensor histidine kinase n=1 Tax=Propioniciclava sp. TaxID=2038686 RepID=UPI0039E2A525
MTGVDGHAKAVRTSGSPVSWFVDAAIGVVIVVVFWALPLISAPGMDASLVPVGAALAAVVFAAVVVRWRWPLVATVSALVATAVGWGIGLPNSDPMLAAAWCLYPIALRRSARARQVGLVAVAVIVLLSGLLAITVAGGFATQKVVIGVGAIGVSWLLGHAEARRLAAIRQASEQQAESDRWRTQAAMAREVHDVVGHALSVISAEADVARSLPDADENELRGSLADIEQRARGALEEVQELVRALRAGKNAIDEVEHGSVDEVLPRLASAARASGLEVTSHLDLPAVPATTGHIVTRIVQEALSNVVRHARATQCVIVIHHEDGRLIVCVDDDGDGFPTPARVGNGLAGMRERVEEAGGELTVTNRLDGGVRVLARLPLRGDA